HATGGRGPRALPRRRAAPVPQTLGVHAEILRDLHRIAFGLDESHRLAPELIAVRCFSPLLLHGHLLPRISIEAVEVSTKPGEVHWASRRRISFHRSFYKTPREASTRASYCVARTTCFPIRCPPRPSASSAIHSFSRAFYRGGRGGTRRSAFRSPHPTSRDSLTTTSGSFGAREPPEGVSTKSQKTDL